MYLHCVALLLLLAPGAVVNGADPTPGVLEKIDGQFIQQDVAFLASDEFAGRFCRSPEAFRAATWIGEQFEAAGLKPVAGGDGFAHAVMDPQMAPNVIGQRPGKGRGIVLITAHYDHLRPRTTGEDRIFNGADDNASGTCGMIAIARATRDLELEATLIFIAFTGEEIGLRGARHVAGAPPFDLTQVRGMFNMDMISRGEDDLIFVDGGREAGPLREALRAANERYNIGLRIQFDKHPDWLMRSDQGPFIRRNIPAVLLSVEDHEDYHKVTDTADKALPRLMERVTRLVAAAAIDLASRPDAPSTTQPATSPSTDEPSPPAR